MISEAIESNEISELDRLWMTSSAKDKLKIIENWPTERDFFIEFINLNGIRQMYEEDDSRDYSGQIDVPETLGYLKGIEEVYLNYQQLLAFPECLSQMESLEWIDLEDNKIKEIPSSIQSLKNLRILNLKDNETLTTLPDLSALSNLEELNLMNTSVASLPEGLCGLKNIKKIVLRACPLEVNEDAVKALVASFGEEAIEVSEDLKTALTEQNEKNEYKGMEVILIKDPMMTALPKSLRYADQVKELVIDCERLYGLPGWIDELQTLKGLYIKKGVKSPFSDEITRLKNLEFLEYRFLYDPREIPAELKNMTNLSCLKLEMVDYESLSDVLPYLKNLKSLELSNTHLYHWPSSFKSLSKLESLDFSVTDYREAVLMIDSALKGLSALKNVNIKMRAGTIDETLFNLPQGIEKLRIELIEPPNEMARLKKSDFHKNFTELKGLELVNVPILND